MDQATSGFSFRDSGRAELFDWMISLALIDFWRLEHPDVREFMSPACKNGRFCRFFRNLHLLFESLD